MYYIYIYNYMYTRLYMHTYIWLHKDTYICLSWLYIQLYINYLLHTWLVVLKIVFCFYPEDDTPMSDARCRKEEHCCLRHVFLPPCVFKVDDPKFLPSATLTFLVKFRVELVTQRNEASVVVWLAVVLYFPKCIETYDVRILLGLS